MIRFIRIFSMLAFTLACLSMAFAQPDGDGKKVKKGKGGEDENGKMAKLIEKAYKKGESERDKVIKEISKISNQPFGPNFADWFDRVATSPGEWDRSQIDRKQLAEIFDRMSERMKFAGNKITRDEFIRYGQTFWREGQSPPWKEGKGIDLDKETEKLFRSLDRDGDGFLSPEEVPVALREDLRRWDRNRDGRIDFEEYRAYFPIRLSRLHDELLSQMNDAKRTAEIRVEDLDSKPVVIAAGKLPAGMPEWFARLDSDQDGQVAMYEWRRAGLSIEEFQKLDSNDDGFLVPHEILKLLAMTNRDGSRPFAYLMELGGVSVAATDRSAKKKKGK